MIYVASPYSSPIPELINIRYERVCEFVDRMIFKGFIAFSPIVYCHPIAARVKIDTDHLTWHNFNMQMLRRAEAMYVLQLPGWEESKGVTLERKVCSILSIPVVYYESDFRLAADSPFKNVLVEQF